MSETFTAPEEDDRFDELEIDLSEEDAEPNYSADLEDEDE